MVDRASSQTSVICGCSYTNVTTVRFSVNDGPSDAFFREESPKSELPQCDQTGHLIQLHWITDPVIMDRLIQCTLVMICHGLGQLKRHKRQNSLKRVDQMLCGHTVLTAIFPVLPIVLRCSYTDCLESICLRMILLSCSFYFLLYLCWVFPSHLPRHVSWDWDF